MLKAVIIDDIDSIREKHVDMISKSCPTVKIVAQANNVASGIEAIKKHLPDVVFLDIDMPDGTGFDLLQQLQPITFKVIFITGFQEHAIKAFKYSAIDYLLKPIDALDLIQAVKKVEESTQKDLLALKYDTLFFNLERNKDLQRIILKTAEKVFSVNIQDIVHCAAEKNYTIFHFANTTSVIVSTTLKEYETMLNAHGFFRVHQSHLININYFDHYIKASNEIVMKDKTKIPLATRKKEEFMAYLEADA